MDKIVSVLIPCLNEEQTIRTVINQVKKYLPYAHIIVCDNNSSDKTIEKASTEGVLVIKESSKGKGNVLKRMFTEVKSDIYIIVDGDATYDISTLDSLVQKFTDKQLHFMNIARKPVGRNCYQTGRKLGNFFFNKIVENLFTNKFSDILSGFKIFSKQFIEEFPCESKGFDIEAEIIVFALSSNLKSMECSANYYPRDPNSKSKINIILDGLKILSRIIFSYFKTKK